MNGARTTPWEGLVHCMGTVLDMEAVEDIDEACWLTITVDGAVGRSWQTPVARGEILAKENLEVGDDSGGPRLRLGCVLAVQRVASYMGTHDHLVSRTRMSPSSVWLAGVSSPSWPVLPRAWAAAPDRLPPKSTSGAVCPAVGWV